MIWESNEEVAKVKEKYTVTILHHNCERSAANNKKLPTNAEIIIHFHCLKVISFNLLKVKGINTKAEIIILIEPNSIAVKPTNPFFISMKELPQMNESAAK